MTQVDLNFWAVVVAAVSTMIVGSIWYAPPVLGTTWMAIIGKSQEDLKKGRGRALSLAFISSLVLAYVLVHFVGYAQATTIQDGIVTGVWVWLGFVVTTMAIDNMFAGRPVNPVTPFNSRRVLS